MLTSFFKISFTMLLLTSCTSYVWNPVDYDILEYKLNQDIGNDFSKAYSDTGNQELFMETSTHKEYIYDKYSDCSWIVKVVKTSNKIEGWHYSYPQRCANYKQK